MILVPNFERRSFIGPLVFVLSLIVKKGEGILYSFIHQVASGGYIYHHLICVKNSNVEGFCDQHLLNPCGGHEFKHVETLPSFI